MSETIKIMLQKYKRWRNKGLSYNQFRFYDLSEINATYIAFLTIIKMLESMTKVMDQTFRKELTWYMNQVNHDDAKMDSDLRIGFTCLVWRFWLALIHNNYVEVRLN